MKKFLGTLMLAAILFSGCAGYKVSVLGVDVKALHSMNKKDCLEVIGGAVTSTAVHVAGHFLAAEIFGVDMELEDFREIAYTDDKIALQWIARGGFLLQLAVNTTLVELAPDSYFTKGFTGFTSLELFTYHSRWQNEGDFVLLDQQGADSDMEYKLFLAWQAYNVLRLSITEGE